MSKSYHQRYVPRHIGGTSPSEFGELDTTGLKYKGHKVNHFGKGGLIKKPKTKLSIYDNFNTDD